MLHCGKRHNQKHSKFFCIVHVKVWDCNTFFLNVFIDTYQEIFYLRYFLQEKFLKCKVKFKKYNYSVRNTKNKINRKIKKFKLTQQSQIKSKISKNLVPKKIHLSKSSIHRNSSKFNFPRITMILSTGLLVLKLYCLLSKINILSLLTESSQLFRFMLERSFVN